ncbi:MAG TPA: ABC transporter substrate-binding protein [Usitatibacter sp.]|jgi:peptide/nickel transport system substrate-binding protein|nr:ABC transporter substrate-binding protein [Usitatibacter sp.]
MSPRSLLLSACLLLACAGAPAKTLRYASQFDPGTMDPHAIASLYNTRVVGQVYDSLVERDEQFRPEPGLALSWAPLDGGRGWRFKLRPGVKFHDGTPFTADDVVFSVQRVLSPLSAQKVTLPNVTGARRIDELTVDLLTAQATPLLPVAATNFRIMSRAWCVKHHAEQPQDYKAKEETFTARNANGTGPYKLVQWTPDVKTVLVANPDYWGKRGNVTEAQYLVIGTGATRVSGLLSGELDLVVDPSLQDLERLKRIPQVSILQVVSNGVQYLGFDYGHARLVHGKAGERNPFRDRRVREAIRLAIDVKSLQSKVMRGEGGIGRAMFSPSIQGYDPRFDAVWPHDLAKSKALLAQAGYADGFSVELDCSAQQPADAMCQAISAMLARVGVRVSYQPLPFNILLPKLNSGDTSMYVIGWNTATAEAEQSLVPLVHTPGAPSVGEYNFGGYSNAKVDALLDRGSVEFDPAKRKALFIEAMEALDADAAFIPLTYRNVVWALRKGVKTVVRPNDVLELRFTNVD